MATVEVRSEEGGEAAAVPVDGRAAWRELVPRAVAHVTRVAWTGLWTGLAIGVLARLLMRLSFLLRPDTAGVLTEAGATIGEFNPGDTVGLVLFGGVINGLLAAAAYLTVEPWLRATGPAGRFRWHGAATVALAASLLGPLAFSDELDFVILRPPLVHVLLFGGLPLLGGLLFWALHRWLAAGRPAAVEVPAWRWGLRGVGLLAFMPVLVLGQWPAIFDDTFNRPAIAALPPYLVAGAATVAWWVWRARGAEPPRWLVRTGVVAFAAVLVIGVVQFLRVALDQL